VTWVLSRWKKYPLKISIIEDRITKDSSRGIWNTLPRSQEFVGRRAEMGLRAWIAEIEQTGNVNVDPNQDDGVGTQSSRGAKGHAGWDISYLIEELIPFSVSRFRIERGI
jgi:hypothetical protein